MRSQERFLKTNIRRTVKENGSLNKKGSRRNSGMTSALKFKLARNNFDDAKILNLSRDYKEGSLLSENHGVIYIWNNGLFRKTGELSAVTGKTPETAFDDSYSSGRDRGVIFVERLIVFDKDIVRQHFTVDHRGFDKKIHEHINLYHESDKKATPFYVDIQKEVHGNEEALVDFDGSDSHWNRLVTIIKSVLDPENRKKHKQSLDAEISPRDHQPTSVNRILQALREHNLALFHGFPGWGKSTMGLYSVVRLAHEDGDITDEAPTNILVVSPIVDTLEGFIESAYTKNYFNYKINVYTTDDVVFYENRDRQEFLDRVNNAKGEINLFVFSVQGVRYANPEDSEDTVSERTIGDRYSFLSEIPIYTQIRDERHTEYNGAITTKIFDKISSRYTLDLTATPYNLLQRGLYKEYHCVTDSMLNALSEKKAGNPAYQAFPDISLVSYTPSIMVQNSPEFSKIYSEEEDWDPRKLCEINDGEFLHRQCFTDLLDLMVGQKAKLSFKKNPFTILNDPDISSVSSNITLVVLPQGSNEYSASDNCEIAAKTCSQDTRFEDSIFTTSYQLTKNRSIKPFKAIKKLQAANSGKRVVIFTHRKMTTGSDVPPMGSIIMFDKMSNPGEFEQLLGRIFRICDGKEKVRLYNLCPNMSLAHHVYHIAKDAVARGESEKTETEMFDCLPLTLIDDIDRHTVSYEEAYRGVLEETRKMASGTGFNTGFLKGFPTLGDHLVDYDFNPLKSGTKGTELSGKNKAKVKSVSRKPSEKESTEEKKQRKFWEETLVCMLNEMFMIGYSTQSKTAQDAFVTDLAKSLFTEENCVLMQVALNGDIDFRTSIEFTYSDIMKNLQSMNDIARIETLFRNEEYKRKQGLVYVPEALARKLLDTRNLRKLYKKRINKGREFRILVPNALSGIMPLVARDLYPDAKIVCMEYFPYHVDYLLSLGFETYNLNRDVDNMNINKKFDAVVSNPPYLKGTWLKFFKKTLELNPEYFVQISPDATHNFSSRSEAYEQLLIDNGVQEYVDCTSYFPNVNSGKICYAFLTPGHTGNPEVIQDKSISGNIVRKIVGHSGHKIESKLSGKRDAKSASSPRYDDLRKGCVKNVESVTLGGPVFKYVAKEHTTIVDSRKYWFTNRYFGKDEKSPIFEIDEGEIGISHNILAIEKIPDVSLEDFIKIILTPTKMFALSYLRAGGFDTSPRHLRQISFVDDKDFNLTKKEIEYIEANS